MIKKLFQKYWLLLLFLIAKMVLQFSAVNSVYELHRDEFLYLDQAKHLALGYVCVPPLSSWVSSIIFFLGGSQFWIRFFPAFFGAITILYAWLIVEELGGKVYSKVLVASALLFSVFVRLNVLYQPNSFDILIWTAIFYYLIRYLHTEKRSSLLALAIAFALGFYNKYNVLFLLFGLLIGIAFTSKRKIYTSRHFYFYLLVGLGLILPNIIWQLVNNLPVVHHMDALKTTQLNYMSTSEFLFDQLKFIGGALVLFIAAFVGLMFHRSFKEYRAIGWIYISVILIFIILKAKGYYAIGLYPVLIALGGVYLEVIIGVKWRKYVFGVLMLTNVAAFVSIFDLILPVFSPAEIMNSRSRYEKMGLLRWNDGKNHELPQDFADMQGWREMAAKALDAYNQIPVYERSETLVFCDNYGQTGAVNYYNRGRMAEAYSTSNDYIFWLPRFHLIRNVVLVGNEPDDNVKSMFRTCKRAGTVTNRYAIEEGTGIFILSGAVPEFTPWFYRMIDDKVKRFDIF